MTNPNKQTVDQLAQTVKQGMKDHPMGPMVEILIDNLMNRLDEIENRQIGYRKIMADMTRHINKINTKHDDLSLRVAFVEGQV